ncbi:tetratricopeptide repeat protein, partial [Mesorhizobium sp. M1A.F.Ca.IN.022.05.2.1]|uniref:tetratricopeptide repeat protein n=1 Tax=Mesorhizobium sp. M1A.F.Ca.IN.022.05.2.1 TaxID=2496760 RepID=UPI000FCB6215
DKSPAESSVDELVARAEAHLAANPSDGKGWDVLAPVYLRLQRYADAVTAYRNAIRLDGDSAARQAGLGEAIANAAGGIVTAEAQGAFDAALKLDPANAKASFYLAMGLAQEGRKAEAAAAWQKMLGQLAPDSPWRNAVQQALAETAEPPAAAGKPATGPDAGQVEATQQMAPQDRQAMIETMVASLDDRLKQNPRDEEGWMRLIRSYVVLGEADRARDALGRAVAVFGADSEQAKKFTAFAASLGVTATE